MPNPAHLSQLRAGVAEWNAWRVANPDVRIDLTDAELRNCELWGANLVEANLARTDLRDAKLSRADLTGACLQGANLSDVYGLGVTLDSTDLDDADLSNAVLGGSHGASFSLSKAKYFPLNGVLTLRRARLTATRLNGCTFQNADLSDADLTSADLTETIFDKCVMRRTSFSGSIFGATAFLDVDLTSSYGLDAVIHRGPSSLDRSTLRRSRAGVMPDFLKGCGLSDVDIAALRLDDPDLNIDDITAIAYEICDLRLTQPIQKYPVFISYSHADADFVLELERHLASVGVRYWRDKHDLLAGRMEKQIDLAIQLNPVMIVVFSNESIKSSWVEWEVSRAVELSRGSNRDVLCPVALDESWKRARWSSVLLNQVMKYNILDFSMWRDGVHFHTEFEKLTKGLGLFYAANRY